MLAAIDTRLLAYAEGAGDETRRSLALALALVQALPEQAVLLPVQLLGVVKAAGLAEPRLE